jgi:hypothetical protein
MSQFEDFVNLELPQRAVMLTSANTSGYMGDPNLSGLAKMNYAPEGTWFIDDSSGNLWQKLIQTNPTSWTNRSAGGGTSTDPNLVAANCLAPDLVGDLVYITGAMVSGRVQVTRADPTDRAKMPVMGMIESKASNTVCTIRIGGMSSVGYTGLTPQGRLFVGDSGRMVQTLPTRPGSGMKLIQCVGVAAGTSSVVFKPGETIGMVPV